MKDRFYPDKNLFIYSFDRKALAKAKRARDLIANALTSPASSVIRSFLNVALKRFERPMKRSISPEVFRPVLSVYASVR
jgi:hypothetical protein